MRILVTGATGYIGGRLIPRLIAAGHDIRVLVRDASRIAGRPWLPSVEVAVGDILDRASLERALAGVDTAYYLVHSMMTAGFQELDRRAAETFVSACPATLRKVIYLGGLLPGGEQRSKHLRSRAEVGTILRASPQPVLELRAGPIIGSGSASFEMLRYLTERLPAMIAPRWIDNLVQPVSIRDVLNYLVMAATRDASGIVEIGADRVTFRQMMLTYASVRGLRRKIIGVPVLAPRVAGLWVGLVTPIPNRLAVPLIEGIVEPVVADTERARALFPEIEPLSYRDAVTAALQPDLEIETRWSGALHGAAYELTDREGLMREVRSLPVDASPARVFATFTSIGGARGWRVWNGAWRLRGFVDRLVGGPGLRRGRRDQHQLLVGEALDFWRVEAVIPDRLLRLRAEMKVPGRAWLQWEVLVEGSVTKLVQTAIFAPRGLFGALYWYALYPLHARIFSDLARVIAKEAEG